MNIAALRRLLIPFLLLIAAILLREYTGSLNKAYVDLLTVSPYVLLALTMALCWFYNRARLFTVAVVLVITYWIINTKLQASLSLPMPLFVYSALSVFTPLLFGVFMLVPERGLNNIVSWWVVLTVPALAGLLWLLWLFEPQLVGKINGVLPVMPVKGYFLSHIASGLFLVFGITGFVFLLKRDSEHVAAVLSAGVFAFITLAFFNKEKISVLMFAAAGICLIISIIRLAHEMAYRDDLTGLRGRRALNERFSGMGSRYVIAMLDVDHFKKFNDTYGHDVGDDVLKMVAKQINRIKGGGKAYRYGGEEFCIVFSGKELETCLPYLEAVRRGVEEYRLSLRDIKTRPQSSKVGKRQRGTGRARDSVSVTISIGVAEKNEKVYEPHDVLKAADQALYRAKKKGRNCIAY